MVGILLSGLILVSMTSIMIPSSLEANAAEISDAVITAVVETKVPKQVNVHVGDDASTQAHFTYTTLESDTTKVVLKKEGGEPITALGTNSVGASNKYFHKIVVSDLEPATIYTYAVGNGENVYNGKFKTAPEKGNKDSIRFVYLADTQVSNVTNGKALGATLAEVKNMNPDFVYLAGDITDTATSELQWEQMFNNGGASPTGGQDMFGNFLIAAIQGNHDNTTFNRHINAPAKEGEIVYSFDYGPITFVMLNLETARYDATARAAQKAFLDKAVAEAKLRGQWTAVGFHKSLYSGASHIVDDDIVEARKYWAPVFAQLDVDMVLQGHDHVYSRGFINESGYNSNPEKEADGSIQNPRNAPLYMVGGHAGGLKWYSRINYTPGTGDPLSPGYTFLDFNSADAEHKSDIKEEQVIVEMNVSNTQLTVNTYMFKYNTSSDSITTPKYLADTLTVNRDAVVASIEGPEVNVVEKGDEITYTVSYRDLLSANAFDTQIEYDTDALTFVEATSLGNTLLNSVTEKDGTVRVITGFGTPLTQTGAKKLITFTFTAKIPAVVDETTVKLTRADTVRTLIEDGVVTDSLDIAAAISPAEAVTRLYSYKKASDINGDGKVTLADLSIAISYYQTINPQSDINLDGITDTKDFILIESYIKAA